MKKILDALKAAFVASRPAVITAVKAFLVAFLAALGLGFGFDVKPSVIDSLLKFL